MNTWPYALVLLACASGCNVRARAAECERVVQALHIQTPSKRKGSSAQQLTHAAREFEAASKRSSALTGLSPELEPLAREASVHLTTSVRELRAAARARKANRASDYAAARARSDEARRALSDVASRFAKVCAH